MGLAHRVIPTILCRGRVAFKGERFQAWRSIGLAAEKVRVHALRGVDEVCLLDIAATPEGRGPDLGLVEELAEVLFTPFTVGGGIRTVEQVKQILRAGADSVVIGTAAIEDPTLIPSLRDTVGSQAVVVAIDYAKGRVAKACGKYLTDIEVVAWAKACALHGAGEILLTSIEREGTLQGYDLDMIRKVRDVVRCPLVAHGGAGTYHHMLEAIRAGADAVAGGAIYQFTDATPRGAARFLRENGVEARV